MRKSKIRIAAAMLSAICCLSAGAVSFASPASAAVIDDSASMQNEIITGSSRSLTGSSGNLTCRGSTRVQSGYSASVAVELQKYTTSWGTIMTWTARGGEEASVNQPYSVARGSYRLKVTHKAYNSSGNVAESFTKYSDMVTY